jgi:hypothetical protein
MSWMQWLVVGVWVVAVAIAVYLLWLPVVMLWEWIRARRERKIRMHKRTAALLIMGVGMLLSQGCASVYMTSRHDREVMTRNVFQAQVGARGAVLGMDVLSLGTGYVSAWRENPGAMLGATALDIGAAAALYYAGRQSQASETEAEQEKEPQAVYNIYGDGNTVITGDGSDGSTETRTAEGEGAHN